MAVAYRSSSSASGSSAGSFTCPKPTGVVAGDVLIAFQAGYVNDDTSMTTPTGGAAWAQLGSTVVGGEGLSVKTWWKAAGASEPATYSFAHDNQCVAIIVAASGGATSTPVVAGSFAGTGTAVTTPSVTPAGSADLEIRCAAVAAASAATFTPPGGLTEQQDRNVPGKNLGASAATRILTGGGATGTADFTSSVTPDMRAGVTVAITTGSVGATINPSTVDAVTDIPAPSVSAGQSVRPATVDAVADIPTPGVSAGQTIRPNTVTAVAVIPTPSVTAGAAEVVEAATVTATADIPTPAIMAIRNATVSAATVDAVADIPTPAVTATFNTTINATTVDAVAVIPTPGVSVPVLPGDSITGDGQVEWNGRLWGDGTLFRVREISGWESLPQIDDLSVEEPARHGAFAGRSLAQRRIVQIRLQVDSISDPTQVSALLRQLRHDTRILRDNSLWPLVVRGYTETLLAFGKVIDRTGVMDGSYSVGAPEPVITIMCPDPRRYSLEQQSVVIAANDSAPTALVNDGDVYTNPLLRFPGPAMNPLVVNETLDRILAFDLTIGAGELLVVDTQRGTVKIGDADHTADITDTLSVPIKEFFLDVGPSQLSYETDGGGAGGLEALWRSAHL
ncbi:hypothetical protein ABT294_00535 [Nonomuraea sp. NPDC000554]|uniref:hypothetical protein n=1 Tax=Nonomuraea sp. NPDC000554 TaxID=3154259 RepID=UPI003330C040